MAKTDPYVIQLARARVQEVGTLRLLADMVATGKHGTVAVAERAQRETKLVRRLERQVADKT